MSCVSTYDSWSEAVVTFVPSTARSMIPLSNHTGTVTPIKSPAEEADVLDKLQFNRELDPARADPRIKTPRTITVTL